VDWYLEPEDTAAVPTLRREIVAYLRRHAAPGSDLDDAELVISELLANAVEHARGPAWISIRWDTAHPVLTVSDLGQGFGEDARARVLSPAAALPADPLSVSGRGLFLVNRLSRDLEIAAQGAHGVVVSATLDLQRAPGEPIDPPHPSRAALPALGEAEPTGAFGPRAYLRALVVQLAHAVNDRDGRRETEAALAQAGWDIGSQMEMEYRLARDVEVRLDDEQVAECLVRLERAIDGDFYVTEVTSRRIVLATTSCPFGLAVRRAPVLCRMTSSVFGGIAARNGERGRAAVLLEERIALGDPGCRVVIWLDPDARDVPAGAHRYAAPGAATPA
jgi:anti-sigma regulatory factor (Ser/Thr protein kinase)